MRHFGLEQWADFARQVAPAGSAEEMRRHLDEGCVKCARVAELWRRLQDVAKREAAYEPPASAVRFVKGYYALHKPAPARPHPRLLARLVTDVFRQPLLAGVRGSSGSPRQLLYRAGRIMIDMRVEPQPGSETLSLVGQVMNSGAPGQGIQDVPVLLLSGREPKAGAITNRFGEFHLEFPAQKSLRLSISMADGKEIIIPLEPVRGGRERSSRASKGQGGPGRR
jgi:hypothetical protein